MKTTQRTPEDRLEAAAELAHDGWAKQKRTMGYHHPDECPCVEGHDVEHLGDDYVKCRRCGLDAFTGFCPKCHADLVPYAELSEATKELDRATVRAVAPVYEAQIRELEVSAHCGHPTITAACCICGFIREEER